MIDTKTHGLDGAPHPQAIIDYYAALLRFNPQAKAPFVMAVHGRVMFVPAGGEDVKCIAFDELQGFTRALEQASA